MDQSTYLSAIQLASVEVRSRTNLGYYRASNNQQRKVGNQTIHHTRNVRTICTKGQQKFYYRNDKFDELAGLKTAGV